MGAIRTSATKEITSPQNKQNTATKIHNLAGVIEDEINNTKPLLLLGNVVGNTASIPLPSYMRNKPLLVQVWYSKSLITHMFLISYNATNLFISDSSGNKDYDGEDLEVVVTSSFKSKTK